MTQPSWRILEGDCRDSLRSLDAESVQTCVTSPPYFGLRDYGHDGQIGLEPTPDDFVEALVAVFRGVRRVLRDEGTLWLNLGDSYNAYNGGAGPGSKLSQTASAQRPQLETGYGLRWKGAKPKDLLGIPWMVAFALRADGWYLRSDIIWHKPNPMPESVTDRPTKAHEYLFLLSKGSRYFYDADAIREPLSEIARSQRAAFEANGSGGIPGPKGLDPMQNTGGPSNLGLSSAASRGAGVNVNGSNKRSVWTVATQPFPGAHFATFPPKLIEPCILAGSREGDTVLDPFAGSGTTGMVALRYGRSFVGCELNPEYVALARRRITDDAPLLNTVAGGRMTGPQDNPRS